jgi:hypothetical protein
LPCFGVFAPIFSGGLIAGRRLSPCPQLFASHGLSLVESRTKLSGAFSYFAGHFRARRRRGIYNHSPKIHRFFRYPNFSYTPMRATPFPARKIAVNKTVDNLTGKEQKKNSKLEI